MDTFGQALPQSVSLTDLFSKPEPADYLSVGGGHGVRRLRGGRFCAVVVDSPPAGGEDSVAACCDCDGVLRSRLA